MGQGLSIVHKLDLLIGELTAVGVPVSFCEKIDARKALALVACDPETLEAAFCATLIKRHDHLGALRASFQVIFNSDGRPSTIAEWITALDHDALRSRIVSAVISGDAMMLEQLVRAAVDRYAGIIAGRPVGGSYYVRRALGRLDIGAKDLRSSRDPSGTGLQVSVAKRLMDERSSRLHQAVDGEVRRRLVDDRGLVALASARRETLIDDVELMTASFDDLRRLSRAIRPVAHRLAWRLHRRQLTAGTLDFRRTLRRGMAYSGVPVELHHRWRRRASSRLLVLVDVSSSVASFAGFTLAFLHGLARAAPQLRAFAFQDEIDEVTDEIFRTSEPIQLAARLTDSPALIRLDGHSDYGWAFSRFLTEWGDLLDRRTVVLILGDGRNNYRAPQLGALKAIAGRSGAVHWLNPEPKQGWATGDSEVLRYARYCTSVVECRSIGQLRRFLSSL